MLALISKAQFKAQFKRQWSTMCVGDLLMIDRYNSRSKQLQPLEAGGALFLVTVRGPNERLWPDERLWLVGILESPFFDGERWQSADHSAMPVSDITHLRGELRFTTGKGLNTKAGALGMSLQTPRQLTSQDVALLRGAVGDTTARNTEETIAEDPRPLPVAADALLQQILADPDDLDVRRVYADLLAEHGDPQGEQIQLACALEQRGPGDPERAELEQQIEAQRCRHGLAWSRALRPIGPFNRSGNVPFAFRRGFPEVLIGEAAEIVPHLEEAARAAPIRALVLGVSATGLKALAASPVLAQIRSLALRCESATPTEAVVRALASPHLRRLDRLAITCRLDRELAGAIAGSEALRGCRDLELSNSGFDEFGPEGQVIEPAGLGPEGLGLLCRSLSGLERLSLHRARVGAGGGAALGALPLRCLSISSDSLGLLGARALARSEGLGGLEELALESCALDAKALAALVSAPSFGGLRRLDLQGPGNGLGRGFEALERALDLPRLEALGLGQGSIRAAGARRLAASSKLKQLVELDLSGCGLKGEGVEALAAAKLPRLRRLSLVSNSIDAGGMEALARGPLLGSVRDLDLAGNKCQNAGGKALATCPHLAGLERLRLHYNWIGVGGLKELLAVTPSLVELICGENNYANAPGQLVARSTTLTRLRRLSAYQLKGPTVTELVRSAAGQRLEQLTLDGGPEITDEGAQALASLSNLGALHLGFAHISDTGRAILRRRFGPFLSAWPPDEWNKLPGPP